MDWIYFATDKKASLASTLGVALNDQILWRSLKNSKGRLISNVGSLSHGDNVFLAWRNTRQVYLKCSVAKPLRPLDPKHVIDLVSGPSAQALVAAGYPVNANGDVEVIRIDTIDPCHFTIVGSYDGNNALWPMQPVDLAASAGGSPIPHQALAQPVATRKTKSGSVQPRGANRVGVKAAGAVASPSTTDHVFVPGVPSGRCFDAYVMVDWSSSSSPTTGNDSIWIAHGEWGSAGFTAGPPQNLATRVAARDEIERLVRDLLGRGQRVLVGLDFAFGYPAGFASALGLSAPNGAWLALHEHFSREVTDSSTNQHNRDSFANECNRRVGPIGPGPFWGCTAGAVTPNLTQHRVGVFTFPYGPPSLEEWRLTERRAALRVTTQSVWKLNCGVSVGGQTILGLKYLHDLAQTLGGRRWPFDTGWSVPSPGTSTVWFVEIFPSLLRYPEWDHEYDVRRDRTQVQSCVRYAAERDADGTLKDAFAQPTNLDPAHLNRVVDEEGWILFV